MPWKTERNKTKQWIPPQGVLQKSCFFFHNSNVLYSYTTLFQNCSHLVPAFHRLHGPPIGCISRMASGDISAAEVAAKKYWDWVGDLFMICFFFESCSFRKLEWWTTFLGNLCSRCDLYLTKFATKWPKMRCFLRRFSWQHFVEQLPRKAMSFLWIQCPMHVKHNGRHGVPKFCLLVWCWAGRGTIGQYRQERASSATMSTQSLKWKRFFTTIFIPPNKKLIKWLWLVQRICIRNFPSSYLVIFQVALSLLESFRPSSLQPDVVSYNFAIGITATNGTWYIGSIRLETLKLTVTNFIRSKDQTSEKHA